MSEQKQSPVLRISAKDFAEMIEKGEAKVVPKKESQAEKLVHREFEAWEKFVGQKLEIPDPPQRLLDTLKKAKEIGWTQVEAHYLPKWKFYKNTNLDNWKKPEERYWENIDNGILPEDSSELKECWIIIDISKRPYFNQGKQMYANDPFADIIDGLRKIGNLKQVFGTVPKSSRFAISYSELEKHVFPSIAKCLNLDFQEIRVPRAIEFNILGNIFHKEWNTIENSYEWFSDTYTTRDARLTGGASWGKNGLAHVGGHDLSDTHSKYCGFRPMIVFPVV